MIFSNPIPYREAGAIPILVQLLTNDSVCTAALGALRNLSFGRQNTENKVSEGCFQWDALTVGG